MEGDLIRENRRNCTQAVMKAWFTSLAACSSSCPARARTRPSSAWTCSCPRPCCRHSTSPPGAADARAQIARRADAATDSRYSASVASEAESTGTGRERYSWRVELSADWQGCAGICAARWTRADRFCPSAWKLERPKRTNVRFRP